MSIRAAIYVRISDDKGGDGAGVDRQEVDARKLAKRLGWSPAAVFVENDTSAYKRRKVTLPNGRTEYRVIRPEFRAMLDRLESGDLQALVAYDLDRVARDPRDLEDLIDLREQNGVQVASVTGSLRLDTDADVTMARVMVAVANKSSRDTGRRVARAHEDSAKAGKFAGGRRRMGYTKSADGLVPAEAGAIRWAYLHVAAGGSLESVVRKWRADLGTGPLGGQITGVQVRDVLLRPMNAGLSYYKGDEVGRMAEAVPTIIDEDTWRIVHAILLDPSRRTTVGRPAVSMLAPVLRCGLCKGRVSARNRKRSKNRYGSLRDQVYSCREGHVSRHRARLDEAVGRLVVAYLSKHADALRVPRVAPEAPAADASREAARLRSRLDELSILVAAGDLAPADYANATREIRGRLAALDERVAKASGTPGAVAMVSGESVSAAWDAANVDTRRTVVKELIARITLHRAKPGPFSMHGIEIEWRHE